MKNETKDQHGERDFSTLVCGDVFRFVTGMLNREAVFIRTHKGFVTLVGEGPGDEYGKASYTTERVRVLVDAALTGNWS